ncbi:MULTISPECIES: flagellar hook-length control protein FliK [unclassified Paludibacterium]|uniref:flagellar hook-length control protein FliK n=1 Tax=unclassified Paludibacterium TaxID=2618429 RepID=UPI001C055941|nr:flagellar hook-length control protein FliK [Paludibacterium sp. B53371]BEV72204.1 hypothetical protein THUN1379_16860 [Paludibacterium sp. THUN1379]
MIPSLPPNLVNPLTSGPGAGTEAVSPLRLLNEGDRALIDATVLPGRLPNLVIGEQVTARIAEQLSNNQVAVLIKNALFTLTLPNGMQPKGDTLTLRVANLKPNLTFSLQGEGQEGEAKDSSVQVDLSPASRYLTRLLSSANQQDAAGPGAGGAGGAKETEQGNAASAAARAAGDAALLKDYATTSSGSNPLLSLKPGQAGGTVALDAQQQQPAQVADHLKQGVEKSGLFYESHLKAWDQGKLPLSQLQQEPQAKLGQALQDPQLAHDKALPELGNLVQRQLNALESQQVPLQGFAWPGQPMQMLIQPEQKDDREGHGDSEETHAWSTHMSLNLPVLGGLSARVRLVGNAVQIAFVTEEASAGGLIQNHSQKLSDGLAAAGLDLATLSVKHEEANPEK